MCLVLFVQLPVGGIGCPHLRSTSLSLEPLFWPCTILSWDPSGLSRYFHEILGLPLSLCLVFPSPLHGELLFSPNVRVRPIHFQLLLLMVVLIGSVLTGF